MAKLQSQQQLEDLAYAIDAFAEWQQSRYGRDVATHHAVAKQLWDEVAEHVRDAIGKKPVCPDDDAQRHDRR
jgi:hypothetical protein